MAIKNINEIQSSNYSKHTEQFYIDALSALANSGQRYGTPGKGFTETSLSIKDIYPNIIDTSNSYIQCTIKAYKGDLERYKTITGNDNINNENFYKSYIDVSQISYITTDNVSRWTSSAISSTAYLETLDSPDNYSFTVDANKTLYFLLLYAKNSSSIKKFVTDNDNSSITAVGTFDGDTNINTIEYIKLHKSIQQALTTVNNVSTNYIVNKKYAFTITDSNEILLYVYKLDSTNIDDNNNITFTYKKYYFNDALAFFINILDYSDDYNTLTNISFYDDLFDIYSSQLAPTSTSFTMKWDKSSSSFTYSDSKDNNIIYNNIITKKVLEKFLNDIQAQNSINELFFKKILINEFYNYYLKLSDNQISVLTENSDFIEYNICLNLNTKFNLLVKTGEDGNIVDDIHYYNTTDGVVINQCQTSDFSKSVQKFILNNNLSDNTTRCQVISDASNLYNQDTGDKYITNLYNYKFNYIDGSTGESLLSADAVDSRLYTMPYLNDNGYWVLNNQLTGVLGTCKHSDQPSIIIIHNYYNESNDTSNKDSIINVVDLPIDEGQSINWDNISGEILSTYRLNDLKKVNFKPYKTSTENLLRTNNISTKYSVPCYLPDVQETIDDVNLNYITDYLKSALFICVTDIDCIPEAEAFKENLANSTITTFWVYEEDKDNSTFFKPLTGSSNDTAVDLFSLSNISDIIKYSTENITTSPDRELFTQVVFDNITTQLKQTTSTVSHYPFLSNVTSYTFLPNEGNEEKKTKFDTTSKIGVIPISSNYTNDANLLISFADTVEFSNGKIINENGISSASNKGIQLEYNENEDTYYSLAVKYDDNSDSILNSTSTTFIDTLDLSGVLINHNNIYNRTNFIVPNTPKNSQSYIYASYIGTDPTAADRSYLVIGATSSRQDINPSLLDNTYKAPFKPQQGLKIEMDNVIINATNIDFSYDTSAGHIYINGAPISTGGDSSTTSSAGPWNWYGKGSTTYSAVLMPTLTVSEANTYISSKQSQQVTTFTGKTLKAYTLNVSMYLKKMYTVSDTTNRSIDVDYTSLNGTYIITNPIGIVAYYNPQTQTIHKIYGVTSL